MTGWLANLGKALEGEGEDEAVEGRARDGKTRSAGGGRASLMRNIFFSKRSNSWRNCRRIGRNARTYPVKGMGVPDTLSY